MALAVAKTLSVGSVLRRTSSSRLLVRSFGFVQEQEEEEERRRRNRVVVVQHLAQVRVEMTPSPSPSLHHCHTVTPSHRRSITPSHQTGEGLRDGEIVEWLVRPGDDVKKYDPLCRVQSDKATVDVTSAHDGTIKSLSGRVGDVLRVGEPLCVFSCSDGDFRSDDRRALVSTSETIDRSPNVDSSPDNPIAGPVRRRLRSYRRSMLHAMQQVRLFAGDHRTI